MSDIQTVPAITGFGVAIIALSAALKEADAVRKRQQASVWPHIEWWQSFRAEPAERVELSVGNNGIGPARVGSLDLSLYGEAPFNWDEVIERLTAAESDDFSYESVSNHVMRPDQETVILSLLAAEMPREFIAKIQEALDAVRLTSRLYYCSVFDECWSLMSGSLILSPTKTCPIRNSEFWADRSPTFRNKARPESIYSTPV